MSSALHHADPAAGATPRPKPRGTVPLALGIAAIVLLCCPALPESVPMWFRIVPGYLVVPVGVCAVVSGAVSLRRARRDATTGRLRAHSAIALGALAVAIPVTLVALALVSLSRQYQ